MKGVCVAAVLAVLCLIGGAASAEEERKSLRVCQDPNNLPFSNTKGEGVENKLAELVAKKLGNLKVEYFSFPQRMGFIRNTLRFKVPGEDFRCDIVMGWPPGDGSVLVTKPYYRSTYALVFAKGRKLDSVKSAEDFLRLPKETLSSLKIGVYDRSPASQWLAKHNLVDQGIPYRILNADPNHYPGQIIEQDLAEGQIDAAVVWGPIAGFFAKRVQTPQLAVLPLKSEGQALKFDFEIAMAVRLQDKKFKQQLDEIIDQSRTDIAAVLRDFGVPLVDTQGNVVQ